MILWSQQNYKAGQEISVKGEEESDYKEVIKGSLFRGCGIASTLLLTTSIHSDKSIVN